MRQQVLQGGFAVLRYLVFPGFALMIGFGAAFAQSGGPAPEPSGKPAASSTSAADAPKENQRKADEIAEATRAVNGPAGNPECVWLGRRVVRLLWNDDLDTAFRHLDLYDRFGCPGGHIQASFRCLTRFGGEIDDKVARSLDVRVHACWINPNAQPQVAAAPAQPPSGTAAAAAQQTTAGNAVPAPAAPAPATK